MGFYAFHEGRLDADTLASLLDEEDDQPTKKRRGRPPGSRNVATLVRKPSLPDNAPDVDQLLNDQLRFIAIAQRQLGEQAAEGFTSNGLKQLHTLSAALVRAVEALARAAKVKQELAERMSPSQILEAAIQRIEGQDLATINMVIRRLDKHRRAMVGGVVARPLVTASDAISAAVDEGS